MKAPKSGQGRSVPSVPQAAVAFDRLSRLGHATGADDPVSPTRTGEMLDLALVRRAFSSVRAGSDEVLAERRTPDQDDLVEECAEIDLT